MTRRHPEQDLQRAVAEFLDLALPRPDAWWTTIPAGGGGKVRGAFLKAAGLKAGVPDILIIWRGRAYWIELKSWAGKPSPAQVEVRNMLRLAGCSAEIARTVTDVELWCLGWGIPLRGRLT